MILASTKSSARGHLRQFELWLLVLLALLAGGCGQSDELDAVQREIEAGRLDEAQELMEGVGSRRATRLRERVAEVRRDRIRIEQGLTRLRAARAGKELRQVFHELRELGQSTLDPVARDWIEAELSATVEWAASREASEGEDGFEPPGEPFPEMTQAGLHRPRRRVAYAGLGLSREDESTREATRIGRKLEHARGDQRDELLTQLAGLARDSRPARVELARVVELRWQKTLQSIRRSGELEPLRALAVRRQELDAAREEALDLIYDAEQYYYPHTRPAVSAERAREYFLVQLEVDSRIQKVEQLVASAPVATLSPSFQGLLQELDALRLVATEFRVRLPRDPELPPWVLVQSGDQRRLTLEDFSWDQADRARIERDARVRAWNEQRWAREQRSTGTGQTGVGACSQSEREQVRLTNAYRTLMGRSALAWNSRLQKAARQHALFMDRKSTLTHDQPEEGRRTPHERMREAGYEKPHSENIFTGSPAPSAAHRLWLRSSLHHRNLLSDVPQEMASAVSGRYWAQKFGRDEQYEEELNAWRD